ncbi:MAG TPA: hypothetical protein VLF42_01550 [Burkholderiales bacterium]|nr:hypothetical protein [Burkholderiales bacterium]
MNSVFMNASTSSQFFRGCLPHAALLVGPGVDARAMLACRPPMAKKWPAAEFRNRIPALTPNFSPAPS